MTNVDALAGGIPYLIREDTAALFTLAEFKDNVRAVDSKANLQDLAGDAGSTPVLAIATVDVGLTSRGKAFGVDIGLQGTEAAGQTDSTQIKRSVTMRAILTYETAAHSDTDIGTIVIRGEGGSNQERILYGMEIVRVNSSTLRLRAKWQEQDGTNATIVGVTFTSPMSGEFMEVAIVRRWTNSGNVLVDYYHNSLLIGSETVTEGDIGEGSGGKFMVGCAGDGSGDYQDFLPAGSIVDCVSVESDEMASEEIRQDYRRIFVHQPAGRTLLRAYLPPGATYSKNLSGLTQRWFSLDGNILGFALAKAEQLRDDALPDTAYGKALAAWERIFQIIPKTRALISERRTKLNARVKSILGYQRNDIQFQLEDLLGLESIDIEFAEFSGERVDGFHVDDLVPDPLSRIWITDQGNGTITIADSKCNIAVPITTDVRWRPVWDGSPYREGTCTTQLGLTAIGVAIFASITVTDPTAEDAAACLYFRTASGEIFAVGIRDQLAMPGTQEIIAFNIQTGNVVSAPVSLVTAGLSTQTWIRVVNDATGSFTVSYSTVGPTGPFTATTQQTSQVSGDVQYFGFGVIMPSSTDDSTSAAIDADFEDFRVFEPNSDRGHGWIVVRPPLLPGSFDLNDAEEQIIKIGPAHADGTVNDSYQGIELGDTGRGRVGRDPLYPHIVLSKDNGIQLPSSAAQWDALNVATPSSLFLMRETGEIDSVDLVDRIGSQDLVASTSPAIIYNQASPDFQRRGIAFDEQADQEALNTSGLYDITSTDSAAMLVLARCSELGTDRAIAHAAPGNEFRVNMMSNDIPRLFFDGASTDGTIIHTSDTVTRPYLLVLNRSAATVRLYTDLEQIDGVHTVTNLTTGEWGLGATVNQSMPGEVLYCAFWFGSGAEGLGAPLLRLLGFDLSY